ncbi:plasmid mobilization protein [Granulicella arctica]|uniref:plasmid mobilization protein n=1 Tax=Granulicella arctica TaxID=940613 RepID=UPI0021E06C7E|nr:hypothetical protein [Granulicella arctica]
MQPIIAVEGIEFDQRLRRSKGRAGRKVVASAKVTPEEHAELQDAARRENKALSEWAREVLLREAKPNRADALLTEIVAMRLLLNLLLKPIACGEVITPEMFGTVLTNVRTAKHKAAQDVMEQYAIVDQKEN